MEQKDEVGGVGPFKPGDMFGDCIVERLLGRGGLGYVYLVHGPDGERYALKALRTDVAGAPPDYKQRFAQEANLMMTMRHRNLVRVYDAGEDAERNICYIMMEYMPGGTLKDHIVKNGAMSVAGAISIATQIAEALAMAHFHGVIHRDVKPDNILFAADGTPKLSDLDRVHRERADELHDIEVERWEKQCLKLLTDATKQRTKRMREKSGTNPRKKTETNATFQENGKKEE